MKNLGFATVTLVTALFTAALITTDAFATTALKQVEVSNGSQIDLLFDGKVSRNQIKTEFFNDIIQVSLTDVSVYPAKISSVNGGPLTKIFAYQYAPKLVRCRFSVKGKAEAYKDKFVVNSSGPNGRMLTISINGAKPVAEASSNVRSHEDAEEAALLERVTKAAAPQAAAPVVAAAQPEKPVEKITDRIVEKAAAPIQAQGSASSYGEDKPVNLSHFESHNGNLTGAKNSIPSPLGVFGKLAVVVGLFALLAFGVKKFWTGKAQNDNAFIGAIGKFARNSLGVKGAGAKMAVEVLSNHHFGPKRSMAVVKVGGRTLVVGITEQSINLISQLSSEEDAMNALVEFDNPPLDDNTGSFLSTPAQAPAQTPAKAAAQPSVGATAAGPAIFAQSFCKTLQSETARPASSQAASAKPRGDVRVTSYGSNMAGATANPGPAAPGLSAGRTVSAQAAMGLSGVRAQIKSKLTGLKEI